MLIGFLAVDHVVNGPRGNPQPPGYLNVCLPLHNVRPRGQHFAIGKPWSVRWVSSSFKRIAEVVGRCSDIKVIGPYASPVVAFVEYVKAIGDWANRKNPRRPMGVDNLSLPYGKLPITIMSETGLPVPAAFGDDDLGPEPMRRRDGLWGHT